MRRTIFLSMFVLVMSASAFVAQTDDKAAVRVPLESYIKGHATVDVESTRKAFHPVGSLQFIREGAFGSQTVADYLNGLVGRKPATDEDKRKRYIESVDVVGNAAIAKVVSDYPSIRYVDYMALLKIDGEWKIVNKIYYSEPKPASSVRGEKRTEEAAVRLPLENYLKAHATGNGDFHKQAFHSEGNLIFIRDGKYTTRSFAEYIGGSSGKPAADEDKRKRWIESIDVTGNAAVGKIILDYPNARLTDYMSLLKINGEWKIVNKIFTSEPKTPPADTKRP